MGGYYRGTCDFHPDTNFNVVYNSINNAFNMFFARYDVCSPVFTILNPQICEGENYMLPDSSYADTSVVFSTTYTAINGCDSILTINLSVNDLPNAQLSVNNNIISVSQTADTYQWINCDTELPIQNEENQTFTATATGNYAVDITTNNCTVRSDCESVVVVGITDETNVNAIAIYPNPSNGVFVLKSNAKDNIVVHDIFGREINSFHLNTDSNFSKTIQLNAGIYFIYSAKTNKTLRAVVIE